MLTCDTLLHHVRKGMYHGRDRQLHTLISYVLLLLRNTVGGPSASLAMPMVRIAQIAKYFFQHGDIRIIIFIQNIIVILCHFQWQ